MLYKVVQGQKYERFYKDIIMVIKNKKTKGANVNYKVEFI